MEIIKTIKYMIYMTLFVWITLILLSLHNFSQMKYISSQYSKYCYERGEENKNIKHKVYYKSLEECGKTLKI